MSQVLNEFVSLESFGFMQDGSLLGYRLEDIEPELRCLIPRLDPSYVFEKDALSIMSAWFEIGSGEPLFISGPHGSGQNQFCESVLRPSERTGDFDHCARPLGPYGSHRRLCY